MSPTRMMEPSRGVVGDDRPRRGPTGQRERVMTKLLCVLSVVVVVLVGSVGSADAWRGGGQGCGGRGCGGQGWKGGGWRYQRPGVSTRVFIGPGYWGPWWGWPRPYWSGYPYPYPYAYPSYAYPPVIYQPQPQVYVQPSPAYADPAPPQTYYWYYCNDAQAYYPYVQQCPTAWVKVLPKPPGPEPSGPAQ